MRRLKNKWHACLVKSYNYINIVLLVADHEIFNIAQDVLSLFKDLPLIHNTMVA